MKPTVLGFF